MKLHVTALLASGLGLLQAGVRAEPESMSWKHLEKVMDKTMERVETFLVGDEDPCTTAVQSLLPGADDTVLATVLESLSLTPCRGRFGHFTEDQVAECLAVQNSPEVQDMIDHGLQTPALVCAWRPFWTQTTANELNGVAIDSCELCQRTTEMIEDTLKKEELAVQVIQQGLHILCQYLPEATKCKVLEERFDDIVEWVKEGFSPKHICTKIKLCTPKHLKHEHALPKPLDVHHVEHLSVAHVEKESICSICRENARIMMQFADSTHSMELYKTGIQSVCRLAPTATSCRFMTSQFDALAHEFRAGASVDEACTAVQACGHATAPTYLSCTFCEYTAGVVESALQQGGPSTLPTVKQAIGIMCSALPAVAQCDVMDEQFDALAKLVEAGKSAEETCETIHMCTKLQVATTVAAVEKTDELECLLCQYTGQIIQRVAEYSQDMVPMVKQGMQVLCSQVPEPGFQAECNAVVAVFDKLAELIEDGSSPGVACREVGLCDSARVAAPTLPTEALVQLEAKVTAVVKGQTTPTDEIQCLFCQYTGELIAQVGAYSKDMVPLVKQGMELICLRLQIPEIQAECNGVVAKFDDLASLIESGATPADACRKVHLCAAKATTVVAAPAFASLEAQVRAAVASTRAGEANKIGCVFCKYTAEMIRSVGDVSEEMVPVLKEGLVALCSAVQLPEIQTECNAVVAKFEQLVSLVAGGASADAACQKVALCGVAEARATVSKELALLEARVHDVVAGKTLRAPEDEIECLFCQYTAQIIAQVGQVSEGMLPLVKEGMQALCGQIPVAQFQDECNAVVDNFDELVTLLDGGASAADACAKVALCGAGVDTVAAPAPREADHALVMQQLAVLETKAKALVGKGDLVGCLLCEYTGEVIVQIQTFSPDLIPLVKEGLEVLCSRLAATGIQEQCDAVVSKFDALAELVQKGEPANVACSKVVLCAAPPALTTASALEQHVAHLVAHPEAVAAGEGCLFCKYSATSIAAVSRVDKAQLPKLREAIATMCTFLPPQAECDAVNEHFDELAALVDGGAGAQAACQRVGLCAPSVLVLEAALTATE
ncbi:hypothetical protein ACHHYP_03967 [Achlya hypogyna]|uniref:Saposin B-type domain-containing protein n=1 Tax=Achlya hypogyna TaxID=1202772 RepID=A0A1V9Z2G3_ACHHY|nr:hypothetical protein ACHHYP_03967 [Achlya hypogyna]